MAPDSDQRPTPDPTILTTEQLLREVAGATNLMQTEITGLRSNIDEQFKSVSTQFMLIERQRVEQKADTEKAVQAALSAAKEAVKEQTAASDRSITKSETAMTEQLKQLNVTFTTAIGGVNDKHEDLKSRVDRGEGATTGYAAMYSALLGGGGLLIGLGAVVYNLTK